MYRPESKRSPAFLQIFDYNIDRCEKITDKRGLEQTLVLAIASCLDAEYDERHKGPTENIFLAPPGTQSGNSSSNSPDAQAAPVAIPLEPNEIFLTPLSEPAHAVEHCLGLLKSGSDVADRGMGLDLVIVRAQGEEMARRALTVAERVKVGFYRLPVAAKGRLLDGTVPNELYLYVRPLEAPVSQPAPSAGQPSSSPIPAAPSPPTSSVRPRIKLGQAAEPTPPAARPAPSSSSSPTPSPATQELAGISVYLSKSKLEEFEAEQALKARQREERQGRELAHRLSQQQQPQSQPHPQHGGAHGPDWLRPPVRHDGGRSPSSGGRTPSPAGSSGAGTDQSVAGESASTNSDSVSISCSDRSDVSEAGDMTVEDDHDFDEDDKSIHSDKSDAGDLYHDRQDTFVCVGSACPSPDLTAESMHSEQATAGRDGRKSAKLVVKASVAAAVQPSRWRWSILAPATLPSIAESPALICSSSFQQRREKLAREVLDRIRGALQRFQQLHPVSL